MGSTLKGYWATHEYKRRSVEKDVKEFAGWQQLDDLLAKLPENNNERNQALFATAFQTGGRIEEVLMLKKNNFTVKEKEKLVIVKGMKLLKRYEKTGSWTEWIEQKPNNKLARLYKLDEKQNKFYRNRYDTEKTDMDRQEFWFDTGEHFAGILLDWISQSNEDFLFPGRITHLSYSMAYRIINATGVYPHWLRAQRASCLIAEYGWPMEQMMEWMGWEELSTARHYAHFGPASLKAGRRT